MEMDYEEIRAVKENVLSTMHCAMPGTVVSYDEEAQTAVIQLAICRVPQRRDVGPLVPPLLRDVPVFMPVQFEINSGDACLVIFADCDIDKWFETGEAEVPESGRMHSLSDGFAFVGFKVGGNGE